MPLDEIPALHLDTAKSDPLDVLEAQSIFVIREAFRKLGKVGMLWSIGKDSSVLLWLVRKAFLGHIPFPLVHVDTTYKIPEMIAFRDRLAQERRFDEHEGVARPAPGLVGDAHHPRLPRPSRPRSPASR